MSFQGDAALLGKEIGNHCCIHWGVYWDNGKENGNYYIVYWGYIGELCRGYIGGYIGIMEKKMETTTAYTSSAMSAFLDPERSRRFGCQYEIDYITLF